MPAWSPDITIDESVVRALLRQFPDLSLDSLQPLSEGWDRSVWLVNGAWAFGFPRRAVVVPAVEREIAVLGELAPLLPLPIPRPAFVGRPSGNYPWPFFGSAFLPGGELGDVDLADATRLEIGLQLARFLRRLHSAEVRDSIATRALPVVPGGRADMRKRVPLARIHLSELERSDLWKAPTRVGELLDDAERLPPPAGPLVVAHGDLHFRHLLVQDGAASGVIDWIDLSLANPAVDLPLLWCFLPASARPPFLAEYGAVGEDQLLRARVLALQLCAVLAQYGHREGKPSVLRAALAGLDQAVLE